MAESPENPNKFTEEQMETAKKWFLTYGKNFKCPVCSGTKFSLEDSVTHLSIPGKNRQAYPMFIVRCKNCAHSILFNALVAKVLPATDSEKK